MFAPNSSNSAGAFTMSTGISILSKRQKYQCPGVRLPKRDELAMKMPVQQKRSQKRNQYLLAIQLEVLERPPDPGIISIWKGLYIDQIQLCR